MNPFYTWPVYFNALQKWIYYFNPQEPLYWPISRKSQQAGVFWRLVMQSATDLDMLDFYGCLDAGR